MVNNILLIFLISLRLICDNSFIDQSELTGKYLIVEGKSKFGTNKQLAKDNAVKNAFTDAITSTLKSLISKEKFDLHFEEINSNIIDKSVKFVKRFIIVKQEIKENFFIVEIKILVDDNKLKKSLASIGLLHAQKEYYKALLLVSIKHLDSTAPDFWWGDDEPQPATKKIFEYIFNNPKLTSPILLLNHFDHNFKDMLPGDLQKLHLNNEDLQSIGRMLNVDIVFFGNISINNINKTSNVTSSFRSINVRTGRNLSSSNYSGSFTKKSTTKDNELLIKKAMIENLKKETKNIISTWVNDTYNSTEYLLSIHGILNYQEYNTIKHFLKKDYKTISSITDHLLSKNKKTLKIESNSSAKVIAKEIESSTIENFKFELLTEPEDDLIEVLVKRL